MFYKNKGMIVWFHTTDLSKAFSLFNFDNNWPEIEHVIVFCATWHSWEWEG